MLFTLTAWSEVYNSWKRYAPDGKSAMNIWT